MKITHYGALLEASQLYIKQVFRKQQCTHISKTAASCFFIHDDCISWDHFGPYDFAAACVGIDSVANWLLQRGAGGFARSYRRRYNELWT